MGPSEQFANKFVKAHASDGGFSVASNIAQQAGQGRRNGNRGENETWQAGLSSEKEQYLETLSKYFNIIEVPRQGQVRFAYTDNNGVQEVLWSIDQYTEQTVPRNALVKRFTFPQAAKLLASRTPNEYGDIHLILHLIHSCTINTLPAGPAGKGFEQ